MTFFRKLTWLAQRRRKEAELREELEFHLAEDAEEFESGGLPAPSARWAARRELGNVALLQEETRAAWGWTLLDQLRQDLRYAFRTMAANRLFTSLAVVSLALGIGANTAIFSFMDTILLRSLPVPAPRQLVVMHWNAKARKVGVMKSMDGVTWHESKGGMESNIFPFPAFELLHKNGTPFSCLFAYAHAPRLYLGIKGRADLAEGEYVSGDFFRGLQIAPAAGRLLLPDDDRVGAPPVAVLSKAVADRRFGSAAQAVNQQIEIDRLPFTVVGVAAPEFFGVDPSRAIDVYLPVHANVIVEAQDQFGFRPEQYLDANFYWLQVMGRLRPGATLAQAQTALAGPFRQWVETTATTGQERSNLPGLRVREGAGGLDDLRRQYSQPLFVLMTLVGLILALACANVANLLLARAAARRREMALRLSVGADRLRVVRQLLTESVLLASLGGAVGILLAIAGMRVLGAMLRVDAGLNWHVFAVAAGLSVLTGILFGLAPALQATRVDVMPALKESRTGQTGPRSGLSRLLVVGQIAISLLMLVAAGLFVRTLWNLQSVELGFARDHMLLVQLDAKKGGRKGPEIAAFYGDLRRRFAAIPGVRNVSLSKESLIEAGFGLPIHAIGKEPNDETHLLTVGPDFFPAMQIPILAGRGIEERDHAGSAPVAVVNERFAKVTFGDRSPIGEHLALWTGEHQTRDMEIVGVARNAQYGNLRDESDFPVVFFPYDQGFPEPEQMVYELRTAGDPNAYIPLARETVHQADPGLPVAEVISMAAEIDESIGQEIVLARLGAAFAILALVIACVGLYGTMAYTVVRRTGEIGIRMALGAQRGRLLWMVMREVLLMAVVGIAISVPIALLASRLVESFLFRLEPRDPLAIGLAVVTLLIAAGLAGYLPAQRASRIDPMIALRHE